jgi:hypothetical protein
MAAVALALGLSAGPLAHLRAALGRYPSEVGLLEDPALAARLAALLGPRELERLRADWSTEVPITEEGGVLHAGGCQAHNCGAVAYELFVDLKADNINLFTFREEKMFAHQEKGPIALTGRMARDFAAVRSNFGIDD